jgi:hypothetical protein
MSEQSQWALALKFRSLSLVCARKREEESQNTRFTYNLADSERRLLSNSVFAGYCSKEGNAVWWWRGRR